MAPLTTASRPPRRPSPDSPPLSLPSSPPQGGWGPRLRPGPRLRRLLPLAFGAAVIVATIMVVGTGPFLRGLAAVTPVAILAAAVSAAVATLAAAWRWHTLAAGAGVRLGYGRAVAEYYRSQFLNSVLPGGVLGDATRAYRHGRDVQHVGPAARAVVAERVSGQLVQLAITAVVLLALGLAAPLRGVGWAVVALLALAVVVVVALCLSRWGRGMLRRELSAVAALFAVPWRAVVVVLSSTVCLAAHVATFLVAALAAGVHASPGQLIAVALLALAAASVPVNVGGWGPREAGAAFFAAAVGLGAGAGAAASTAFGALSLIALLPGAAIMLADRIVSARTPRAVRQRRIA